MSVGQACDFLLTCRRVGHVAGLSEALTTWQGVVGGLQVQPARTQAPQSYTCKDVNPAHLRGWEGGCALDG